MEPTLFENALTVRWFTPRGRFVVESVADAFRAGHEVELTQLLEPLRRRGVNEGQLDLRGVTLDGVCLAGLDLSDVDLSYASLVGCDLRGACLSRSVLWGARLRDASLREAVLEHADLSAADLTGADLSCASLVQARLAGACLESALTGGADLSGVNWGAYSAGAGARVREADAVGRPPRIEPLPANSRRRRPSRRGSPSEPRTETRRVSRAAPPPRPAREPSESGRHYQPSARPPQVENHVEHPEQEATRRERLDSLLTELESWFPRSA